MTHPGEIHISEVQTALLKSDKRLERLYYSRLQFSLMERIKQ